MIKDWEENYKRAVVFYETGKYPEALSAATEAKEVLSEKFADVLRKRAWAARQVGYKNPAERNEKYKIAKDDTNQILAISKDIATRNSAIKLLILLPGEDVKKLCYMGVRELSKSNLSNKEKKDLKGDLENSLGLEVKKSYLEDALRIFNSAYETVSKGTTLAGHLKHNAGTCWLEMANAEKDNLKNWSYLTYALDNLEKALEEYPEDQIGHRKAVERKIEDIKRKIEEVNNQIEEENK